MAPRDAAKVRNIPFPSDGEQDLPYLYPRASLETVPPLLLHTTLTQASCQKDTIFSPESTIGQEVEHF